MTSWIPTFQYSERIGSVKEIVKVLQDGADGSNLRGREKGDDPIPKSFVQFELKPPPASAHLVQLAHIKAIQCVTHIPQLKSRNRRNHSDFTSMFIPRFIRKKVRPFAQKCTQRV